ncbi:ATP-dependent RecD-like DNA helicase [Streptomyces sp. NBC_00091]|uniref:helix-hairpin-helix domain-containing protein n=1 Tax=Streptomyces sp. NBC_00091 TaxID=2975648 RepID=UPI0022590C57|nr:ATP-dependent RecD-like DNA helicase [Streptomyces sp. NBC_00091]MCX5379261.1 ATP-dependent RecD-like DNA helicase [Streptomyces sp. NBC_00091]
MSTDPEAARPADPAAAEATHGAAAATPEPGPAGAEPEDPHAPASTAAERARDEDPVPPAGSGEADAPASTGPDGDGSGEAGADGREGPGGAPGAPDGDGGPGAEPLVSGRGGVGESPAGPDTGTSDGAAEPAEAQPAPGLTEAQAELAAQKVERERIARRKAEREAPVEAGGKLSGKAADLMAAVRAVESGAKPAAVYFDEAPAAPRKAAPAPPQPRPAAPAPSPAPAAADIGAVRAVLTRGGAPEALAGQAAEALGEGAAEQLAEDPWRLLVVPGVRPAQADGFAQALLGAEAGPADERRGAALLGWLLAQAAVKGHTALEAPVLEKALAQYGVPAPAEALESAIGEGAVLVFHEPLGPPAGEDEEQPVRILVGLEEHALAEEALADGLARLAGTFGGPADWSAAATGPAAELVRAVAGHGLVTHTGGEAARAEPRALLAAARELGLRACLAAHAPATGVGVGAVTVAGLLAGTQGPGRDADGRFDLDLLIVLDAPQLDVETAAALVESVPDGARLVLSGDPGVLGSAGPGRVFADVLAARAFPQVVSRTPDPGPIGELVSGVGIGELNQVDAPGKEVVIVPVRDAGEAVHRTVQLVAESVPRAFGIPADAVQVITPGHGGSAGTRALNAALKERLNPGPGRFGGFDPGDRVVHVPSPGRALPARVVSADAQGLHLDAAGARVVVPKERVESQVRHGWAVTAHQAVGARWPAVVVVLPGDAAQALSRDWVYTAFGRAERHLSVVHGVDEALPRAVAQVLPKPRTTRLTGLLRALTAAQEEQP